MASLRFRLTIATVALVVAALALGWFAPMLIELIEEDVGIEHLVLAALIFVGLSGVAYYSLIERSLNPVMSLMDSFARMRAGDLNPRLPVEGPAEMCRMARSFNDMVEDLELQIRDIEIEKQDAERLRDDIQEQFDAIQKYKAMVDSASIGVIFADRNLNVVYQNPVSESAFMQLEAHMAFPGDSVIGRSLAEFYEDAEEAARLLKDPDHLPFEAAIDIGPHRLRFLASAVYDQEADFAGPVIVWEVDETEEILADDVDAMDMDDEAFDDAFVEDAFETMLEEADLSGDDFDPSEVEPMEPDAGIDEEVLAEVEELEASAGFEVVDGFEVVEEDTDEPEPEPGPNGAAAHTNGKPSAELVRSANLVSRSVRVLGDRLAALVSSVEALCSEGDTLQHALEEVREQVQSAGHLTAERSESLWELVTEMDASSERSRTAGTLVKRLKKAVDTSRAIGGSVTKLEGSIEQMVVAARIELARAGEEGAGLRAVVDAVAELSRQTSRLREEVESGLGRLAEEVDDVTEVLDEESRESKAASKLTRRAEGALGRIERDLADAASRNELLIEMAEGQSKIGAHLAERMQELGELIRVTVRVADEQVRIAGGGSGDDPERTRLEQV